MKKRFIAICLVMCFIFSFSTVAFAEVNVEASHAIMVEAETGNVMWSKNGYEKAYPASTTKVMTATLYYEKFKDSLDKSVTVGEEVLTTPSGSSIMGLKKGEVVTRRQLLYGLMLVSGNDAAIVMAADHSGSVAEFVKFMNKKAKEYGMNSTSFANPHGFHDKNHYTTAYDFSIATRKYMQHEVLREIGSTQKYDMPATNMNEKRTFFNSNRLISIKEIYKEYNYEYATGLKTGYTGVAKNCLIATGTKDENSVIVVSFGSEHTDRRFLDARKLLDYGLTSFSKVDIYKHIKDCLVDINASSFNIPEYEYGKVDAMVQINNKETVSVANDIIPQLEGATVETKFTPLLSAKYPINEGDEIGYIEYMVNGNTIYTAKAVSTKYMEKRKMPTFIKTASNLKNNNVNSNDSFVRSVLNMGIELKKAV